MRKRWHSRQFILYVVLLFLTTSCGLSEMFGGSNAKKITEPCIELIPAATPTPTPIQTVIPIVTVTPKPGNTPTPQPGKTPTPSQSCGNAPGIVLICDGEPEEETPITVITPPGIYYTLHVSFGSVTICSPGGVSPSGFVSILQGTTAKFSISFGTCSMVNAYLDGSTTPFASTGANSITLPNINANHDVYFYFYAP